MTKVPPQPNAMLVAARDLATRGYPVLPLRDQGKIPRVKDWVNAATTEPRQVEEWWRKTPLANVGVLTGSRSGIWVLDIDEGGEETLATLEERHGPLPVTVQTRTGSGGRHIWFAFPADGAIPTRVRIADGLDVRGEGGQVVAPGSIHPSTGEPYAWIVHPDEVDAIPEAPPWLVRIVRDEARTSTQNARLAKSGTRPIPDGERNDTLFRIASRLRRDGLGEESIRDRLLEANRARCKPMLTTTEVATIVRSASKYEPSTRTDEAGLPNLDRELTDLGCGRRFERLYGRTAKRVAAWNKWVVYDGRRWTIEDGNERSFGMTEGVALDVHRDIATVPRDDQNAYYKAYRRVQSTRVRRDILTDAASRSLIDYRRFDQHPELLNTPDGTVNLATGALLAHDSGLLLTQVTRTGYDPVAECPRFERFLAEILGDEREREYMRRFLGAATTGYTRDRIILVAHGRGLNGKTTLFEAVAHALGRDYAGPTAPGLLMLDRHAAHPTNIADLYRKRLVWDSESDQGKELNAVLAKQLSGNDTLKARRMREDFWEFTPTHSIALITNFLPRADPGDVALWDRLRPVEFRQRFEHGREDKQLAETLRSEARGILAWLARAARDWIRDGLGDDATIVGQADAWRSTSDSVGRFLAECAYAAPDVYVPKATLTAAYHGFCSSEGLARVAQHEFTRRLREEFPQCSPGQVRRGGGAPQDMARDHSPRCVTDVTPVPLGAGCLLYVRSWGANRPPR